jgi:DNA modification methylase
MTAPTAPWRNRIVGSGEEDPTQLLANPRNWRTHPGPQRDALRGSLSEVGWVQQVLVNRASGHVVDGHARVEEAISAGAATVPVLYVDLTDEEEALVLATLDPIGAMATTDEAKLAELLAGISVDDAGLLALLGDLAGNDPKAGLTDPDEVPEARDEPTVKRGDLFVLGDHRLLCGDSGDTADLARLLDGASIHLVNTDPPYNVKVEPRSNNAIAAGLSSFSMTHHQGLDLARHPEKARPRGKMRAKDRPLVNDYVTDEAFVQLLDVWFHSIAEALERGRSFYIWGGYANVANYPPALKANGLYFSQTIIWDKEWPVLTRKDFMGAHEWCFYGWREGAGHWFNPEIHNATDLWSVKKINPNDMVHLTEKPVELAELAMTYSSRPGENVLDLFGGSGSTMIAAERMGRHAYMMEIDPAYCDVIVRRWEQFTGRKAEQI